MNDTIVPPPESDKALALRRKLTRSAVTAAFIELISGNAESSGAIFPDALPDDADGIAVSVAGYGDSQPGVLGGGRVRIELSGRSADPGFPDTFTGIAAGFPRLGLVGSGVIFKRIDPAGECTFSNVRHHGIVKHTASVTLEASIDLLSSEFPPLPEDSSGENPQLNWTLYPAAAVERAFAEYFSSDGFPVAIGFLPEDGRGAAVHVAGAAPLADAAYREFTLEFSAHAPMGSLLAAQAAALAGRFPAEAFDAGALHISGAWCDAPAQFGRCAVFEQEYQTVGFTFTVRVPTAVLPGTPPAADEPARKPEIDPAALERGLANLIGQHLTLTVDGELCRGYFPPPGGPGTPVAAVRLTGVSSGNCRNGYTVDAVVELRTVHRNDLFRKLMQLDSLLPLRRETVGGHAVEAILKREFQLDWCEHNGRNMLNGRLALQLIL